MGEAVVPITSGAPYDWRKSALKGARAAGGAALGIAIAGATNALLVAFSNPATITATLGPAFADHPALLLLVAPLIAGLVEAYRNRKKQQTGQ